MNPRTFLLAGAVLRGPVRAKPGPPASARFARCALSLALLSFACGEDPTFTRVQSEVFTPSCVFAACHQGASAAGDMSLEAPAYARIVNVPSMQEPSKVRVKPGDPDGSYLVDKLLGRAAMGTEMPPGAPLSDDRLNLVRDWIEAGALND